VPLTLMTQLAVAVALSDRPLVASSDVSLNHVGCKSEVQYRQCDTAAPQTPEQESWISENHSAWASYGGQGAQVCCTSAHLWHLVSGEVWAAVARRSDGQRHPDGTCTIITGYVSRLWGGGMLKSPAADLHPLAKPHDVVEVNAGNIAHSLLLHAGSHHGRHALDHRTHVCTTYEPSHRYQTFT
jgi:hypothetical protein